MSTASSAYDEIREEVILDIFEPELPEDKGFYTLFVDFKSLMAVNSDIVGWLFIPDTPVSYPLLHGSDNHKYLNTTFDNKNNIFGSIFLDYRNDSDFSDMNTIIYGHNTSNDTMFGSLKAFKDQDFAEDRLSVHIIREDSVLVYEIFTIYETLATSDTYIIGFVSSDSYKSYIADMTSKSIIDIGAPPDLEPIITLSTCTGGDRAMRLVLQAKFVESHSFSN